MDLFPDKVYVFTPRGDILRLPRGATCVDFAYAVHTDVGRRCVAAKIDRRLVPLRTEIRNGQTVEIITVKEGGPSRDWLNHVVTAKARSRVRHWIAEQQRAELGQRVVPRLVAPGVVEDREVVQVAQDQRVPGPLIGRAHV